MTVTSSYTVKHFEYQMGTPWRTDNDLEDDLQRISKLKDGNTAVVPPPKTILEYNARMERRHVSDPPEVSVVYGRGRGVRNVLCDQDLNYNDYGNNEEITRLIRQVIMQLWKFNK